MSTWTPEEIATIARETDVRLSADRPEGDPQWVGIWGVTVGDRVDVRSFNGTAGTWYGAALARGSGHVSAGSVRDRAVVAVDGEDEDAHRAVDVACHEQYDGSPDAEPLSTEPVRRTILEVVPRA